MLDLSPDTGREPLDDYKVINGELFAFDPKLAERETVVVLNKIDIDIEGELARDVLKYFADKGIKVFKISAVTGEGIDELVTFMGGEVERQKSARTEKEDNEEGKEDSSQDR
ncbi:MAG: hypothetical protein IME98_02010 [Proteobacteria bacterium]|nr:hypothetical protein [Pseudomonadota bacterium]